MSGFLASIVQRWHRLLLIFRRRPLPAPPPPAVVEAPPPPPLPPATPLPPADADLRDDDQVVLRYDDVPQKVRRKPDVWLPGRAPKKRERKPRDPNVPAAPPRPRRAKQQVATAGAGAVWDMSRAGVEEAGTFYFRGALLNDLPRYFRSLRRLRGADPNSYHLCSTIGMSLMPVRMIGFIGELPVWWHDASKRPNFGAASFADHDLDEGNTLRLTYFQHVAIPSADVEPTSGQVYRVTCYFDDFNTEQHPTRRRAPKWLRKHGVCLCYYVSVDVASKVRVLRQLQLRYQHVSYRSGQHSPSNRPSSSNGSRTRKMRFTHSIPMKLWDYPEFMRDWYRERFDDRNDPRTKDDEQMARHFARTFICITSFANANDTGVRVAITARDGLCASFALDMKRSAYFFKDRDVVLTAQGKRARVFHVVRPHIRHLQDGRELPLKMHFRGLRKFPWGEYQVHITVPGLHHSPLIELMPELYDYKTALGLGHDEKDLMTTKAAAKEIREYLEQS